MDFRALRLTQEVKKYDSDLFVRRTTGGMLQVCRDRYEWDTYRVDGSTLRALVLKPQVILALTDTWNVNGRPVEWGIEPVMVQLRSMDTWTQEGLFEDMVKRREKKEADKQREFNNNVRAAALDMRPEFAKATNDINASSLGDVKIGGH